MFKAIGTGQINKQVLIFGLVFVVAGLGFKLGVVPFHMWVPDVYQGAPTAVTLLIGGAPKLAALRDHHPPAGRRHARPGGRLAADADRAGGRLADARQPRRDRADQPEAHAGLLDHRRRWASCCSASPPGVVSGNTLSAANAYSSAMFYVVTYVLTTLGTFGLIMLLARQGFEAEEIADFAGLAQRSPLVRRRDGDLHVLAGRRAADGRLLRQAGGAAGAGVDQRCRATSCWRWSRSCCR